MSGNVVDNLLKGSNMNSVIENHLALRSTNSQLDQYCALPDIALKPRNRNKVKIQTNMKYEIAVFSMATNPTPNLYEKCDLNKACTNNIVELTRLTRGNDLILMNMLSEGLQ